MEHKTRFEWLSEKLPAEYVQLIMKRAKVQYMKEWETPVIDLQGIAISNLFIWDSTPEGYDFWNAVGWHLHDSTKPLPPLP